MSVSQKEIKKKKKRRGFISHCSAVLFFSYSAVWYVGREVYSRNTTCVIHSASQCVCTVTAVPGEPTGADNRAADMKKPLTRPLFTLSNFTAQSLSLFSGVCSCADILASHIICHKAQLSLFTDASLENEVIASLKQFQVKTY